MCGIAGIFSTTPDAGFEQKLQAMQRALNHRGPDDRGMWEPRAKGQEVPLPLSASRCAVGLVHTRLSILDLSPAGHQPMQSADGRLTIVFNGEIYNFRELRAELHRAGYNFKSDSDTEVLLALYRHCGAGMVNRLRGMFAFAIWDSERELAFLARDPLGIKPLYYHTANGRLVFASELRALLASDAIPKEISAEGVLGYLQTGSLPEPLTLLKDVFVLEAGHSLEWRDGAVKTRKYWDLASLSGNSDILPLPVRNEGGEERGEGGFLTERASSPRPSPPFGEEREKTGEPATLVREALLDSVRHHFISDVPVGIFLSGGIDSTAVLALARETGQKNLKTFSIGFAEKEFDESSLAARTAKHFGAEHHEWIMSAKEGRELFAAYLDAVDQPSIDGFNTFCVSRFARDNGLKVVLSGLGGDELFAGYASFSRVPQMMSWHRKLRGFGLANVTGVLLQKFGRSSRWRRLGEFFRSNGSAGNAYQSMRGIFTRAEAERVAARMYGIAATAQQPDDAFAHLTPVEQVGCLELSRYMRNQLLRDSDVMSMASSLELRVPFVDRALIETLFSIAPEERLRFGKQLLLEAVPEVPQWIREQPKRGFRFPFQEWLSSDWKEPFEALESKAGMPLDNWYEKWSLFLLEHAVKRAGGGSGWAKGEG